MESSFQGPVPTKCLSFHRQHLYMVSSSRGTYAMQGTLEGSQSPSLAHLNNTLAGRADRSLQRLCHVTSDLPSTWCEPEVSTEASEQTISSSGVSLTSRKVEGWS